MKKIKAREIFVLSQLDRFQAPDGYMQSRGGRDRAGFAQVAGRIASSTSATFPPNTALSTWASRRS
jgi:hypothetical protein